MLVILVSLHLQPVLVPVKQEGPNKESVSYVHFFLLYIFGDVIA